MSIAEFTPRQETEPLHKLRPEDRALVDRSGILTARFSTAVEKPAVAIVLRTSNKAIVATVDTRFSWY